MGADLLTNYVDTIRPKIHLQVQELLYTQHKTDCPVEVARLCGCSSNGFVFVNMRFLM